MLKTWLLENGMGFWFQVNEICRETGLTFHQNGDTILFVGESYHPLAGELLANEYTVGTWENVSNRNSTESTEERNHSTTEPELAERPVGGGDSNTSDGQQSDSQLLSDKESEIPPANKTDESVGA